MGRKANPTTVKEAAEAAREARRRIVQLYYRDCGHEVRVWTYGMADYGQFEVMDKADFEKFKIAYQRFHFESSVLELHDCDRYEPGDNLDGPKEIK